MSQSIKAGTRLAIKIESGASRSERKALGKAAREKAPIKSHSQLCLSKVKRDILELLEKSNEGRIKELIPLRWGRMLNSPFTFYRGSAALMARDLAGTPASGLIAQVCGDCHIHNFGAFATPERKIVLDINDFDETLPAPWEWDIKRLAASLVLAASENGFATEFGQDSAMRMVEAYRQHMALLSEMTHLEVWSHNVEMQELMDLSSGDSLKRRQKALEEAKRKSSPEFLSEKFVTMSGGKLRFKDIPPLLTHIEGVKAGDQEKEAFASYHDTLRDHRRVLLERYELIDLARKVVGIGSVGTLCGVLLLSASDDDCLILQVKEARKSVLEPYAGKSKYKHNGERVVAGQKLMQAATDQFLGWTTGVRAPFRHFFIRQLRDVKIGANTMLWSKADFKTVPPLVGKILARAHARSGDASFMRGYLGKSDAFELAIGKYAVAYARQTERDFAVFGKACKSGRLKVQILEDD